MADTKTTGLAEITSLADDDVFMVVDKSDTSMAASGTNKGITRGNVIGQSNLKSTKIRTPVGSAIDNMSTAGSFSWSSIPAVADADLVIEGIIRGDITAVLDTAYIFFNSDTTVANYHSQRHSVENASPSNVEQSEPEIAICTAGSSPSNSYTWVKLRIPNYANTDQLKNWESHFGGYLDTTRVWTGTLNGNHKTTTAAISAVDIEADGDPTDQLYGRLAMYIEQDTTVGGLHYPGDVGTVVRVREPIGDPIVMDGSTVVRADWQNIPDYYDRLVIIGEIESDAAVTLDPLNLFFNNDTTATNYYYQHTTSKNTGVTTEEGADAILCHIAGSSAVDKSSLVIDVPSPASGLVKRAHGNADTYETGGSVMSFDRTVMYHDSMTAVINRLTLQVDGDPTDALIGTLQLYGEREIVMAPGKHELETIIADGSTITQFDFQNIPAGFKRLWVEGYVESDKAATTNDALHCWFNNDTTAANYWSQRGTAIGSSQSNTADATATIATIAAATAVDVSTIEVKVEGYDSGRVKSARGDSELYRTGGSSGSFQKCAVFHDSMTAAINRLTFKVGADNCIGKLTLYGEM